MDHIPSCPGSYKITHRESGFFYVGSSNNIRGRIKHHIGCLRRGTHVNKAFQQAFVSTDLLDVEIHPFETLMQARDSEQEMIDKYLNDSLCCNVGTGAHGTWKKGMMPFSLRETNRLKGLGNQYAKGHIVSDEVKDAVRRANTGKIRSAETLARMSEARAAIKKPVDIEGVRYGCVKEAAVALGLSRETIRSRLVSPNPRFVDWLFV